MPRSRGYRIITTDAGLVADTGYQVEGNRVGTYLDSASDGSTTTGTGPPSTLSQGSTYFELDSIGAVVAEWIGTAGSPLQVADIAGSNGVFDYPSLPVGSTVRANTVVSSGGFIYRRTAAGTITGSFTASNWTPVYAGGTVTNVGDPSTLQQGALCASLDGSGNVTGLWLGTATTPTKLLDATGPLLYGTAANRPAANTLTDGTVYFSTDTHTWAQVRSSAWVTLDISAASAANSTFGNGGDGALTFDGAATVAGLAPASSVYTMSRDLHATTLTINTGVTVKVNGFRLFCTGALVNNGTINGDGQVGLANGTAVAGTGGTVAATTSGAGNTGAGSSGNTGYAGGGGGAGGTGSGGAAGSAGSLLASASTTQVSNAVKIPHAALAGVVSYGGTTLAFKGGGSGGGGSGDATNKGGSGGTGGLPVVIFANTFTNSASGVVTAVGGAGGTPATGNCGGGGGGGGGCLLVYSRFAWTQSGTVTLTAGAAGSGVGTGTAGAAGATGISVNSVLV